VDVVPTVVFATVKEAEVGAPVTVKVPLYPAVVAPVIVTVDPVG
jgi:hypothetical protein